MNLLFAGFGWGCVFPPVAQAYEKLDVVPILVDTKVRTIFSFELLRQGASRHQVEAKCSNRAHKYHFVSYCGTIELMLTGGFAIKNGHN